MNTFDSGMQGALLSDYFLRVKPVGIRMFITKR